MERIRIPLHYCKSRVPLVVFRALDDKPRVGIIDTGSEVTMIDPALIGNGMEVVEGNEGQTSFVSVNGEGGFNTVAHVSGTVRMSDYDIQMSGISYDCSNLSRVFSARADKEINVSMIIGSDFLKERNSKIDYKNKTMTIDF